MTVFDAYYSPSPINATQTMIVSYSGYNICIDKNCTFYCLDTLGFENKSCVEFTALSMNVFLNLIFAVILFFFMQTHKKLLDMRFTSICYYVLVAIEYLLMVLTCVRMGLTRQALYDFMHGYNFKPNLVEIKDMYPFLPSYMSVSFILFSVSVYHFTLALKEAVQKTQTRLKIGPDEVVDENVALRAVVVRPRLLSLLEPVESSKDPYIPTIQSKNVNPASSAQDETLHKGFYANYFNKKSYEQAKVVDGEPSVESKSMFYRMFVAPFVQRKPLTNLENQAGEPLMGGQIEETRIDMKNKEALNPAIDPLLAPLEHISRNTPLPPISRLPNLNVHLEGTDPTLMQLRDVQPKPDVPAPSQIQPIEKPLLVKQETGDMTPLQYNNDYQTIVLADTSPNKPKLPQISRLPPIGQTKLPPIQKGG